MTGNWDSIQQEITRLLFGDPHNKMSCVPRLQNWRDQASWIRILGDRRLRTEDLDASESDPVLALTPVLAALWRLGTVVVITAHWDGHEFYFHVGRANSSQFGSESLIGAFPPDLQDDLVIPATDPLKAILGQGGYAMKLSGRPLPDDGLGSSSALEAMAVSAGSAPVTFFGVLSPVGKDEAIASTLELQTRLRKLVNPGQLLETDLAARSLIQLVGDEVNYRITGIGKGLWKHHGFLLSDNKEVLHRAAGAIVCAQNAAEDSPGQVLDWSEASLSGTDPGQAVWSQSEDLAGLYACPVRPLPGFAIEATCQFDVPRPGLLQGRQMTLGHINVRRSGGRPLPLLLDDLQRHLLICGVTGSGKTQTSFHLLLRLWLDHQVPWLVIEPVKGDYWRLARSQVSSQEKKALEAIRLLTLGDASPGRSNPISINPFVFPEEIPLSTHLDLLKSVFFAGFVLYPPMPYVLETALVKTYEDKGWDLITSDWGGGRRETRFPTLTDFIASVDEVVSLLGWSKDMQDNIRTSLLVRLENLRRGGKGLFLDGPTTWTIDQLLDRPTILELSVFGSDEEKSFVSGLIFGLLAEWRQAEERRQPTPDGLRHVLVIEEAHRLFRRTNTDQGSEGGNVRGQAVERISGLLTEIRSYGQGVIIIDQSPEKLAPDAVRNTGTKIIHRIVAAEDREAVARAANLSGAQERELVVLPPGQAVLAAENIREPVLVGIPLTQFSSQKPEDRINLLLNDARKTENFGGTAAPLGDVCRGCRAVSEGRCGAVRAQVRRLLNSPVSQHGVIPATWLLATGTMKMPVTEALARSLENFGLECEPAQLQCASGQIPSLILTNFFKRNSTLAPKTEALLNLINKVFIGEKTFSKDDCLPFQSGQYLMGRCQNWCSHPCLFGNSLFQTLRASNGLIRDAQTELSSPTARPDAIMIRLIHEIGQDLGFPGTVPRPVSVCFLMVFASDLKGNGAEKRNFVDRVMKSWLGNPS